MPLDALLLVRDLHAWYGQSHVLHGMEFHVKPGEVVTLLGRNGAGKTSTMRALMGTNIRVSHIGSIIRDLKTRGFTIVLVEQNFHFARTVADRHYVVEHGQVIDMMENASLDQNMGKLTKYLGV